MNAMFDGQLRRVSSPLIASSATYRHAAELGLHAHTGLAGVPADAIPARQRAFAETAPHQCVGLACQEVFALSQLDAAAAQHEAIRQMDPASADIAVYLQPTVQGVSAHHQFTLLAPHASQTSLTRAAVAAAEALAAQRGFLSRPYHPWAHVAFGRDPHARALVQKAKTIFDPANTLNPSAPVLGTGQ